MKDILEILFYQKTQVYNNMIIYIYHSNNCANLLLEKKIVVDSFKLFSLYKDGKVLSIRCIYFSTYPHLKSSHMSLET